MRLSNSFERIETDGPVPIVNARDILELKDEQLSNPQAECAAAGGGTGTTVRKFYELSGDNVGARSIDISRRELSKTLDKIHADDYDLNLMAHTHGPEITKHGLSGPSEHDLSYAEQLRLYGIRVRKPIISLLLEVRPNSSARINFFDGQNQNMPFKIRGLDGKIYSSAEYGNNSFPLTCWKTRAAIEALGIPQAADGYEQPHRLAA